MPTIRARMRLLPLLIVALLSRSVEQAASPPAWNDLGPRGFAQELLLGYATQRTPRFNAYTKHSYRVLPAELAAGLPKEAALYKVDLRALLVRGPAGPAWSYDVVAFLQERDCTRVNWVVMAHARITLKRSSCVAQTEVEDVIGRARALATLPVEAHKEAGHNDGCVLFGEYGPTAGPARRSKMECDTSAPDPGFDSLYGPLNGLYKKLQVTYNGDPRWEGRSKWFAKPSY